MRAVDAEPSFGELLPDSVVLRHSSGWSAICAGFAAALPLPLLATIGAATILLLTSEPPQPRRWFVWALAIALFCGVAGSCAGLVARWGKQTSTWGDLSAGLVLWPASFPPSYAFVITLDAVSSGRPNALLTRPVPSDWLEVAAEGMLLAACFATAWFGTWRWLFVRLVGLLSRADRGDVAAELLRGYYRRQWLAPAGPDRSAHETRRQRTQRRGDALGPISPPRPGA